MEYKRAKKSLPPVSVGGVSVLMVFVALCMTTFGILSLSTAQAEMTLTKTNADSVASYYVCESAVQEAIGQVYEAAKGIEAAGIETVCAEINGIENASAGLEKEGIAVFISKTDGDAIGVRAELYIAANGGVTVLEHCMFAQNEMDYSAFGEELWTPAQG